MARTFTFSGILLIGAILIIAWLNRPKNITFATTGAATALFVTSEMHDWQNELADVSKVFMETRHGDIISKSLLDNLKRLLRQILNWVLAGNAEYLTDRLIEIIEGIIIDASAHSATHAADVNEILDLANAILDEIEMQDVARGESAPSN